MTADLTAAVTRALIANCVDAQDGIHSWRCEYPPLNGQCGCLAETVADVIAAAQPIIRAQVAAEIRQFADSLSDGQAPYFTGFADGLTRAQAIAGGGGQ